MDAYLGGEGAVFVSKCTEILEYVMSINVLIVSLQADIMDINEIFKDLGMMIHEQGDVIGKSNSIFIWKFFILSLCSNVELFAGKIPVMRISTLKQIRCNLIMGRLAEVTGNTLRKCA